MTFYNDSFASEADVLISDPPTGVGESFVSEVQVLDHTSPAGGDAFESDSELVTPRQSNSLTFTFILPSEPEQHAIAYVFQSVQLSSRDTSVQAFISMNVTEDIPTPHIWYVAPDEAYRSQSVAIVGMGFGETQEIFNGYVTFGPTIPPPTSWVEVPPSLTDPVERMIHANLDVADPEHQRITFDVPNNAVPGEVRVLTNTDAVVQPPPAPPEERTDSDSASAVESESLAAAISSGDAAVAADAITRLDADKFGSDSATGAEGELLMAAVTGEDTATGAEGEALVAALEGSDTATGADAESLSTGATTATFVLGVDPPASTVNMGGTTYTFGTIFTVDTAFTLVALWFIHPAGVTVEPGLWDGSGGATPGTLLGSGSGVAISAATWTRLPLTTPVALTAGQQYAVGIFGSTGNHYFTTYNGSGSVLVSAGATLTPVTLTGTNYGRYGASSTGLSYPVNAVADANPNIFSFKIEGTV